MSQWLDEVRWDEKGLVPVIAQDYQSNEILMFAWMNREALAKTAALDTAVYWSRSRQKLWHKGEESGHTQIVHEIRIDCDEDGHTGRQSCLFRRLEQDQWVTDQDVLKDPDEIYGKKDNE